MEGILLDHIVIFEKDHTIFAAGREADSHIKLFLINEVSGNVYARNGKWTELYGQRRNAVIEAISDARYNHRIPVYRIAGATDLCNAA